MTDIGSKNLLCYGDNLDFLSDPLRFPNECVDLIYLDPPFNSQQSYNVLFKEAAGTPEAAQIKAFEDTWTWDLAANKALVLIHQDPAVPAPLVELMKTFMNFLKASPMMAYLVQMAIRLVHMHRVLKPTGSLYLHCDPTASHYLKLVLDATFGPRNFVNEIVWKRSSAHSDVVQGARHFGRIHDTLLLYGKSNRRKWNPTYLPYDSGYLEKTYRYTDQDGRRYQTQPLHARKPGGDTRYEWKGQYPPSGRYWAFSKAKMEELDRQGRIVYSKTGVPRYKIYLDESKGVLAQDFWDDVAPVHHRPAERLGYETQKPIQLLGRIVASSSDPGDVVMDPFCGCGTTIDAVETLNREHPDQPARKWIGIDITHLAINLIKHRLTRFVPPPEYEVIGEPVSRGAAAHLAREDPFQFQFWALGLIGARPVGGSKKKGADRGIDGVRYFVDEVKNGQPVMKKMLVQVKGGHAQARDIRDLIGVLTNEGAEMGVFVTLEEPTAPMKSAAATAGMYVSPFTRKTYPKVQILTIEELLSDPDRPNPRCLQIPAGDAGVTLPKVEKHRSRGPKQKGLEF